MDNDKLKRKAVSRFLEYFDNFIDGGEKYYVEFDEIVEMVAASLEEDYEALNAKEKVKRDKSLKDLERFVGMKSALEFAVVMYGKDFLERLNKRFEEGDIQPSVELMGAIKSMEAWQAVLPSEAEEFFSELMSAPQEIADNFKSMKYSLRQAMRAAVEQLPYLVMQEADIIQELRMAIKELRKEAKK